MYWAAPPYLNLPKVPGPLPGGMAGRPQPQYVDITNDFGRRCVAERAVKKIVQATGATLKLPPLSRVNARRVEEALIAHFGLDDDGGRLLNRRHEISPSRVEYCKELMIGQAILRRAGYGRYATIGSPEFIGGQACFRAGAWQ